MLGFGEEQLARFGGCALRGRRDGPLGDFVEFGGGGVGPLESCQLGERGWVRGWTRT